MPIGIGSLRLGLNRNATPLWLRLIREAEAAAAAAGASLWYVPPDSYAARSVNGPFVGSDGSGGVPAVGSGVVGWLRDGAAGPDAFGANLTPDGDFSAGQGGWSTAGSGTPQWAFINGRAEVAGTATANRWLVRGNPLVAGRTYRVTFTVGVTAGSVNLDVGNTNADFTASGTYTILVRPTITTFQFIARTSFIGWVDDVSVREIPGNHATQPTSANRPVLVAAPGAAAAAAGFGALSGDGTDDWLTVASARWSAVGWAAAAVPTHGASRVWRAIGNNQHAFGYASNGTVTTLRSTELSVADYVTTVQPAGAHVVSVTAGAANPTAHAFFLNGTLAQTVNGGNPSANALTDARIGWAPGGNFPLPGGVGLYYAVPTSAPGLTTAQREAIERLGAYIVGAPYPGL